MNTVCMKCFWKVEMSMYSSYIPAKKQKEELGKHIGDHRGFQLTLINFLELLKWKQGIRGPIKPWVTCQQMDNISISTCQNCWDISIHELICISKQPSLWDIMYWIKGPIISHNLPIFLLLTDCFDSDFGVLLCNSQLVLNSLIQWRLISKNILISLKKFKACIKNIFLLLIFSFHQRWL